jgi:hypothetical protein
MYVEAGKTWPIRTVVEARPKDGIQGETVRGVLLEPYNEFDESALILGNDMKPHHVYTEDYAIEAV